MKKVLLVAVFVSFAPSCFAQLTREQKLTDFKALVALYDKNYGPFDWKKQVFAFDLLNLQPWLDQVEDSRDDLTFYDVCIRYVASLHDSHDEFILPSEYEAFLPLTADIYDGKVLIDFVDTTVLDPKVFTFAVGDELVSLDGVSVGTWVKILQPYSVNASGNAFSRDRIAVATILDRFQAIYPLASRIQPGDSATVVIRNQTTGNTAPFSIPWQTIFIPLFQEGPVPNPKNHSMFSGPSKPGTSPFQSMKLRARLATNPWHVSPTSGLAHFAHAAASAASSVPASRRLRQFGAKYPNHVPAGGLFPFDSPVPLFNPPPGFQLRLGANPTDEFLSGTFPVGNQTIGFIRIPSFAPFNEGQAVQQFQGEITFFQQNTGGLVVDVMGNGGGDGCYMNLLIQYLVTTGFQPIRLKVRATEGWVISYEIGLFEAELIGAGQDTITTLTSDLEQILQALGQERGNTPPINALSPAACFLTGGALYPPATDAHGNNLAYTKPIVVLTTNFSISAAEFFGATLQDANRVTVYGVRTDGGGGNVVEFSATPYSEGLSRVTLSLGVRNHDVSSPGFPTAPFIENIGVVPDVQSDFQTRANLLTGGQPFVQGFSNLILKLITTGHP
jgi:hypothetical protein